MPKNLNINQNQTKIQEDIVWKKERKPILNGKMNHIVTYLGKITETFRAKYFTSWQKFGFYSDISPFI